MPTNQTSTFGHDEVRDAELDGVAHTKAAAIAGELNLTTVDSVTKKADGEYRVKLQVFGGFTAFGSGGTRYAIKSVVGQGHPETISLVVVEKQV